MLEIKNISKSYYGISAIDNCSFNVSEGSITGLIGPNGAGKTTLFNIISGFEKPDTGSIFFKGIEITKLNQHEIVSLGLCRTFQLTKIFPELTCLENILVSKKVPNSYKEIMYEIAKNDYQLIQKSIDHLKLVNLSEKTNTLAKNLSYGQQKLLELARTLATEPKLILMDEPIAGVNPTMIRTIKEKILEIKNSGKTILLIEHNLNAVMEICDEVIVMDYGKKIAEGKPRTVKNDKKFIEAYLGVKNE